MEGTYVIFELEARRMGYKVMMLDGGRVKTIPVEGHIEQKIIQLAGKFGYCLEWMENQDEPYALFKRRYNNEF